MNNKKSSNKRKSVLFVKSAVDPKDYPLSQFPEIAITGRSNAGKSSLINAWLGAKTAYVSQTPGKTRLLNFFEVDKKFQIVDMPGYGFAARSGAEMRDYQKMVEGYFSLRSQLVGLILVMDSRRDFSEDEELLVGFAKSIAQPVILVATKLDKLNQKERVERRKALLNQSGLESIFFVSSVDKEGIADFEEHVYERYIKPKVKRGALGES